MPIYMESLKKILMSQVVKQNECWVWTGNKNEKHYGRIYFCGTSFKAHRFFYELFKQECIDNKFVCHKCDNPPCVNPDHMFLRKHKENSADMVKKGRSLVGSKNPDSRLIEKQVKQIRLLYETTNITQNELGKRFAVSGVTINNIITRKHWKHI